MSLNYKSLLYIISLLSLIIIILKGPLSHIKELDMSSSEWQGFYTKYRQCHMNLDLSKSDLLGDIQ